MFNHTIPTTRLVEEFLVSCDAAGLAERTVAWYRWALSYTPELLPCTPGDLEQVLAGLKMEPKSKIGIYASWSAFFSWAQERHDMPNPLRDGRKKRVRKPKADKKPIRIFNRDEQGLIWNACQTQRDRAIIGVLFDTGVRLGELTALRWEDVGQEFLSVDGKTGPRSVPYSRHTRQLLVGLGDTEHVFTGLKGHLTPLGVGHLIVKIVRSAGITGPRTSAHCFRHTFATEYLRAGGNVFKLQRILGHTTLAMTMRYVHLVRDDLAEGHEKMSPFRRIWTAGGAEAAGG